VQPRALCQLLLTACIFVCEALRFSLPLDPSFLGGALLGHLLLATGL
jgi:hypothetical protein